MLLPLCIDSKPPVAPKLLEDKPEPEPEPTGVLPCKSGKLNVDEPSPVPYVVPIAENSAGLQPVHYIINISLLSCLIW